MAFQFKSSGKKVEQVIPADTVTYYGLAFPLQTDDKVSFLKINTEILDQITDDLKSLILTNQGERLGRYNYGANLKPLLSEMAIIQNFDDAAAPRIINAVETWMPFVQLLDMESKVDQEKTSYGLGVLNMKISFSVPTISSEVRTIYLQIKLLG